MPPTISSTPRGSNSENRGIEGTSVVAAGDDPRDSYLLTPVACHQPSRLLLIGEKGMDEIISYTEDEISEPYRKIL